uniref:Methyltransferase FkbM family n=1 Tax=Solibacter usitatus (strain Ellin6076) TaxID=234267 RepID=Q01XK7_SOLUE
MTLKPRKLAKAALQSLGYTCRPTSSLPLGQDIIHDLRRLTSHPIHIIFDVGAHLGSTALAFSEAYPKANIYSFEPSPETFKTLLKNCAGKRIQAFQYAVGSDVETAVLYAKNASYLNSLVPELNAPRPDAYQTSVPVTSLDHFCTSHEIERIDLLKSDTEGYELEVLKGAKTLLRESRIGAIYVECALTRSSRHIDVATLLTALTEHGYFLAGLYEQAHFENRFFCNALFLRGDRQP